MGSKTPTTTEQKQVQTSAPPSWMQNVFKRGGADAYQMYNTGVGGNVYGGPRVASLSAPTYQAIEGLGNVPHQYQSYMNHLMNMPMQAERNIGELASSYKGGYDQDFEDVLQKSKEDVVDTINSYFAGSGGYGSGAHTKVLTRELDALSKNARINHYRQNKQDMLQANALLGDFNKHRLGMVGNLLPAYNNAYTNMLQGSGVLNDYNQRLVDANRERWLEQDNRGWNRLNMLMNAGHGFARNYGTTTNNMTSSKTQGNDPWKNVGTIGSLALQVAPMAFGYMAGGPMGAALAGGASKYFLDYMKDNNAQ
ncbi:hypothetical protein [Bartonella sp. MM73XJBT.G]|uniref:hypothetical protein n=1 Tax=Bartonella sp. MM73XJBT.G TaxID=3019097 RepID=UPI002362E6FA|nr:hypothetical protein [Bartonella sp. MM73XJBT.G]